MLISVNPNPSSAEFKSLMEKTDILLNKDALTRPDYYATRGGSPLEDDVKNALDECAKGTPFSGTIEKVSGQKFPDIVAAKLYGVEVKSTKKNQWKSTGSSILETTRIDGIERIYMTFGKLGGRPIQFLSKPYEECLSGIAVTHMPRYLINMQMSTGETIFDKIGVPYDVLRKMDDPVVPVAKYYRSQLKEGERLWWTGDSSEESVSATIRLWGKIKKPEKRLYTEYAFVNFPEVLSGFYDNYSLWLASQGIVGPSVRDQFSSGGQEVMLLSNGKKELFPGVFRRIKDYDQAIIRRLRQEDPRVLFDEPVLSIEKMSSRLLEWIDKVSRLTKAPYDLSQDALITYFWRGWER